MTRLLPVTANTMVRTVQGQRDILIYLLAVAADLGGGLPEFDCRKLEKQPDIAQNADYMIVVHAAFTPSDTTPPTPPSAPTPPTASQ